jgi:hypothetical protein
MNTTKTIHPYLIVLDEDEESYYFILKEDRDKVRFLGGKIEFLENFTMVDMEGMCETVGLDYNVENVNEMAYLLDEDDIETGYLPEGETLH